MGKYDDIINLPRHVSDYHKPMPIEHRAAQFAPFAALSGHDDAIEETSRITDSFKELTEEERNQISKKLLYAFEKEIPIKILYFVPDKTKKGGSYSQLTSLVKKWDEYDQILIFANGQQLPISFISDIEIQNDNY